MPSVRRTPGPARSGRAARPETNVTLLKHHADAGGMADLPTTRQAAASEAGPGDGPTTPEPRAHAVCAITRSPAANHVYVHRRIQCAINWQTVYAFGNRMFTVAETAAGTLGRNRCRTEGRMPQIIVTGDKLAGEGEPPF